jgi:hypothetical protein
VHRSKYKKKALLKEPTLPLLFIYWSDPDFLTTANGLIEELNLSSDQNTWTLP